MIDYYNRQSDLNVMGDIESSRQGKMIGAIAIMPTASAEYNGYALLYTGSTTAEYTNGAIYLCSLDGTQYKWKEVSKAQVDSVPTQGSTNPVASGGVYTAVADAKTELDNKKLDVSTGTNGQILVTGINGRLMPKDVASTPIQTDDTPISSKGVYNALTGKIDTPATTGNPEQVLTLDSNRKPVWATVKFPYKEVGDEDTPIFINGDGEPKPILAIQASTPVNDSGVQYGLVSTKGATFVGEVKAGPIGSYTGGFVRNTYITNSTPSIAGVYKGDLWIDTSTYTVKVFTGSDWLAVIKGTAP